MLKSDCRLSSSVARLEVPITTSLAKMQRVCSHAPHWRHGTLLVGSGAPFLLTQIITRCRQPKFSENLVLAILQTIGGASKLGEITTVWTQKRNTLLSINV